jgi:hypothetical protein
MTVQLDPLVARILGLSFKWADSVLNAPDHARAKLATQRHLKALEYVLQHGDVPPEGWQPEQVIAKFESHHYGIAGEGVEVETWKGLTPP